MKVGDPLDPETQMGSLISQAHRERVHGFVEQGRGEGAEVVLGGEPARGTGAFYPPTVIAGVDNAMTVAQEEIFGPVVTVIPFEDEAEAIRIANDVRYGLMATVWTGRSRPRPPDRGADQVRHGRDQHAVHRVPRASRSAATSSPASAASSALETLDLYLETKSVIVNTGPKPINPFGL